MSRSDRSGRLARPCMASSVVPLGVPGCRLGAVGAALEQPRSRSQAEGQITGWKSSSVRGGVVPALDGLRKRVWCAA